MLEFTPEVLAFIEEQGHRPIEEIALLSRKYPEIPVALIAQQLKGRRRSAKKLPSWEREAFIRFPSTLALEQCSSEATARYKASLVSGTTAVDLTGGFGVDATLLAQRFDRVTYLERNPELTKIVGANFERFSLGAKVEAICGDAGVWMKRNDQRFDLVYLDPARRDKRGGRVSGLADCEPDVTEVWSHLLEQGQQVMLKASPGLDIDEALRILPHVWEAHVVSVENECKELLFLAAKPILDEPNIVCVNLKNDGSSDRFVFRRSDEKQMAGHYGPLQRFLYESNASLRKAGAFKTLGQALALPLLSPRTRFYTADRLLEAFPGRSFEVLDQGDINPRTVRKWLPERRAHVIANNCGCTAAELRSRLKVKEGGDRFLIGCRDSEGFALLLCRRI